MNAPVWMGDLSFKTLGEIQIGDEVIGFAPTNTNTQMTQNGKDEHGFGRGSKNRLCKAKVTDVRRRRSRLVKLTLASGKTIRCTPDHKWLRRQYKSWAWSYGPPEIGWYLADIIDVTPDIPRELQYEAGWLGGIYDGEGCAWQIGQHLSHNPEVYAQILTVANRLGLALTANQNEKIFTITGGRQGYLAFLNAVKPIKRWRLEALILGSTLLRPPDQILSIEDDGDDEEVVCLTTTSGNYVVWGYASKNSGGHPESIDVLMEWPYRRFLKAFDAFQRRLLCDEWRARKTAHICALFANTNFDDEKNDRQGAVQKLEENYDRLIARIWNGGEDEVSEAEEQAWGTNFMRAGRRALDSIQPPVLPGQQQIEALPST